MKLSVTHHYVKTNEVILALSPTTNGETAQTAFFTMIDRFTYLDTL